ncbi:MAG: hypothetical protein ACOH2V_00170 [Candidatus Saccharimonadaceae bacterium]
MTGVSTFTLDTNTYSLTSHTLESHSATVTAGKLLRGSGLNTFAWSTLTMPDGIAAKSIFVSDSTNILTSVTPTAGQSIRINAGNTA